MPNQYDKVTLYIENDLPQNKDILSKQLSIKVVELLSHKIPKDDKFIDKLINEIDKRL